jgi:hypothetical protein
MNGVLRACSHAGRFGALLASDREMKIVSFRAATQDLNAGPGAPLFPCMLHRAGCFALPAACALEWVDRKKPVSDHVDDLFSMIAVVLKVWRETPDLFLIASQKTIYEEANKPRSHQFSIVNDFR